ncbi:sigma-70 family RNA polymerase sigma factor [Virgibacillus litoralis]|nr:sigma-70 family RNA polymerase sigma factor [Virgibacillus litoralis]
MYARPGIKVQTEKVNSSDLKDLYSKLIPYCHYLTKNKWDAEDLVQETLFKAINHYGQHKDLNAALLKKMAFNLWMDLLQKRNREIIGFTFEETDETNEYKDDMMDLVEELISKLTPKQSVIVALKDVFRYQIMEIAEMFDMTETAVKAVLNRARKRLARLLLDEEIHSVRDYWSEENVEVLTPAIIQAVRLNDPTGVIRLIPILFSMETQPKLKLYQFSPPQGSFSMAA